MRPLLARLLLWSLLAAALPARAGEPPAAPRPAAPRPAAPLPARPLPPVTATFQRSALLELRAVLGDYPLRHGAEVTAVGFSADGGRLASVGGDRKIKLWRADGAELLTFGPAKGRTYQVVFSPDGGALVTTSTNGNAVVWDTATGATRLTLAHGAPVPCAVFLDRGRRLATAGRDRAVKVWDLATGALVATASFAPEADAGGPGPAIVALAAPARGGLVVALADGGLAEVDPATGTVLRRVARLAPTDAATLDREGARLLTAGASDLRVVEVATGADRIVAGNVGLPAAVAISADGRRGLFAGRDGKIGVFDLGGGGLLYGTAAHTAEIMDVALSPDGRLAATASRDTSLRLWDVAERRPVARVTSRALFALAFVDDGHLAAAGVEGEVRLWDLATATPATLGRQRGAIYGLAALDGTIVSAGDDGTLRFWDPAGAKPASVKAHAGGAFAVAASPDGKRLLSAGADERVRSWDPKKRRPLAALTMGGPTSALALAPDGKRGVAGDDDGAVRLFAVPSMALIGRLRGHDGLVLGAAFTPDGRTVLTASEDDTLGATWGRASAAFTGHRGPVTAVVAATRTLAFSASRDGTLVGWDLNRGQSIDHLDLAASDDQPLALALAPSGRLLAVATARGVILVYALTVAPP